MVTCKNSLWSSTSKVYGFEKAGINPNESWSHIRNPICCDKTTNNLCLLKPEFIFLTFTFSNEDEGDCLFGAYLNEAPSTLFGIYYYFFPMIHKHIKS